MVIDFHTHMFPGFIRKDRSRYFAGEPAFRLLYESPKSKMVGAREMVASMDENQVDISVVFGFPWMNPELAKRNNDYILEAVSRYPNRLRGFCCVNSMGDRSSMEVERCLGAGLSGVGELAFYESGIEEEMLKRLEPIMGMCLDQGKPVLIHTNEPVGHLYPGKTPNTMAQIYSIPKYFPDNKIVLAHWGGGIFFYQTLKKEVKETLKNVYYDTAASPYLYDSRIYNAAAEFAGEEKILFGSDYPLIKPARYLKEIAESGLGPEARGKITGINGAKLLGLK